MSSRLKRVRFIPAPAGNRRKMLNGWLVKPVHPRACGEQSAPAPLPMPFPGSSPRLRGTVKRNNCHTVEHRFIPAPAGNSSGSRSALPQSAVHPRACGEQFQTGHRYCNCGGSSPRLRGTVHGFKLMGYMARIGSSPRLRGTVLRSPPSMPKLVGSSPRLRGTAPDGPHATRPSRFIPAPAGNSRPIRTRWFS